MKQPLRPALPKLLLPLVLGWLSIVLAAKINYQGVALPPLLPLIAAVASVALALWWLIRKKALPVPVVSLVVACLLFASGNHFYSQIQQRSQDVNCFDGQLELIVVEDTRHTASSQGSEALVTTTQGQQVRVRIFWNDTSKELPKGSYVKAHGTFTPLRDDQSWLFERGIIGTLSLSGIVNEGFAEDVLGAIDSFRQHNITRILSAHGEGAALLAGVLLGYRESLQDTDAEQDFITCGLTHLIAVSGSHLAVVAALLSWFLRLLPLGRISEVSILMLVLVLYVVLTGLQPSAIRAAIMAGVAGCSIFVGRRGHAPSALVAAAIVMLLAYPANAFSLGFGLSVCAVMGITLFTHLVAHWVSAALPQVKRQSPDTTATLQGVKRKQHLPSSAQATPHSLEAVVSDEHSQRSPGAIASALALTITASTATLPLAVPIFAVVSLIGPLANLIVAPLISLVLVLGMIALVLPPFCGALTAFLLDGATWISDLALQIAAVLATLPSASAPAALPAAAAIIIGVGSAVLLYIRWPQPTKKRLRTAAAATLILVCALVYIAPQLALPRLVVMDVGQGDALLVQEQGHTVLIDTGASETELVHALARNGVHELEAIIITHLDSDHAGALGRLRGLVHVERIYFARGLFELQADDEHVLTAARVVGAEGLGELAYGDSLQLGNTLSLAVVWPLGEATEGSNAESICLLLRHDNNQDGIYEQQALLTGDAESAELQGIVNNDPLLTAQIIKVGHHGSRDALTSELLSALKTNLALISVGSNNRYGHPAEETLEILAQSKVRVMRTDQNGDISCTFRGAHLELDYANMLNEMS